MAFLKPALHACCILAIVPAMVVAATTKARDADAVNRHAHVPEARDVGAERTSLGGADSTRVPVDLASGQPVVEVMLDGRGPYRMFVDTGAGTTVVDRTLADELGLSKVGETRIGDPADPQAIAAAIVRIDSLRVGGATFTGIRAATWDRSALRRMADPPRGVIGFALWRELLLTLDYPGATLRLARGSLTPTNGGDVIGYTDADGIPSIRVGVGDASFTAHLDTGSPGFLSIPAGDSARVHFAEPLRVMGRGRTVNSEILFRGARLAGEVTIGVQHFANPVVMLNDMLPFANLGGRALRDFVLTFDQRAKVLRIGRTRVSPPEAFGPPPHGPGPAPASPGTAPAPDPHH